jgi:hypothetical protein
MEDQERIEETPRLIDDLDEHEDVITEGDQDYYVSAQTSTKAPFSTMDPMIRLQVLARIIKRIATERKIAEDQFKNEKARLNYLYSNAIDKRDRKEAQLMMLAEVSLMHLSQDGRVGADKKGRPYVDIIDGGKFSYRSPVPSIDTAEWDAMHDNDKGHMAETYPDLFDIRIVPKTIEIKKLLKDGVTIAGFTLIEKSDGLVFKKV